MMMLTIMVDLNVEDTNRDKYVRAIEKLAIRKGLDTCVVRSKIEVSTKAFSSPVLYAQPYNLPERFTGMKDEFTVDAIMSFLEECLYTRVVIINRSDLIGKPLLSRLITTNCTVSVIHSQTEYEYAQKLINGAEVIISATGKDLSDTYNLRTSEVKMLIDVSADFAAQWGWENINGEVIDIVSDIEVGQRNVKALVEHVLTKQG